MMRYRWLLIFTILFAGRAQAQMSQDLIRFHAPVSPNSVVISKPSYAGAVEGLTFSPLNTTTTSVGAIQQYQWQYSTDSGTTWLGPDGTSSTFYGTPSFVYSLSSGSVEVRCRAANPQFPITGNSIWVPSSNTIYVAPSGGGGSLPTDYISGCYLKYSSTTVIQVTTGSAYSTAAASVITVASTISNTPTLAASTLYFVYLTDTTHVEVTSTAPTLYQGTAWQGGTGGSKRYLGSFLTDGSSHIVRFTRSGNRVAYLTNIAASPFEVLGGGTATTATSVSCAGVVPPTSSTMLSEVTFNDGGVPPTGAIGTSDNVPTTLTGNLILGPVTGGVISWKGSTPIPLNASQAFEYVLGSSSSNVYVWCEGYMEDR